MGQPPLGSVRGLQRFDAGPVQAARKLLDEKFTPMLLELHDLTSEQKPTPALVNDLRLVKANVSMCRTL